MTTTAARAAPATLPPLLERYLEQLRALRREAEALTADLDDARFAWQPGPGRWSVGEIVAHLNVAGRDYLDGFAHSVSEARRRGLRDRGDYRHSWIGRLLARSMEPPPRKKFKHPRPWTPRDPARSPGRETELATWRALHGEVEERIREAAGVDLRRAKFVSPASKLVRMNAGDALWVLLAHERRHLWQLRKTREAGGFAAS